jgi:hypothetical protein
MAKILETVSYAFAGMAGLCFFGGVAILTGGKDVKHGRAGQHRCNA